MTCTHKDIFMGGREGWGGDIQAKAYRESRTEHGPIGGLHTGRYDSAPPAKAIEARSAMIACEHGPKDESAVPTAFAQEGATHLHPKDTQA